MIRVNITLAPWLTACLSSLLLTSAVLWPRGCLPLLVPLALQVASDRVRAHLHALLATKDVPVVMEPHACQCYRVSSTLNADKHSLDAGTKGHVQPFLKLRHTGSPQELDSEGCLGWQFWFQVPFWEQQRSRKLEVIVWLL